MAVLYRSFSPEPAIDALATAELFLVLRARLAARRRRELV
jgi:hypothetical protein